jgi:hypothetical protein
MIKNYNDFWDLARKVLEVIRSVFELVRLILTLLD